MNAQTTIRARRANINTKPIGTHLTLTRVVNDSFAQKYFAFAVTDDGEEVYIPAMLVRKNQMTEHDVGAGFHAILKDNNGYDPSNNNRVAIAPIQWDGEVEEIVVDTTQADVVTNEELEAVEADLSKLADSADDLAVACAGELDNALVLLKSLDVKHAMKQIEATRDKLEEFRTVINEIAPDDADGD